MKTSLAGFLVVLLVAAIGAAGQEAASASGDYDMARVEAGLLLADLDGTMDRLTGGARIVLYSSKDPGNQLPISANEIRFVWSGGELTGLELRGRVEVDHPQVHVKSDNADWDMSDGVLTFTGDPVIRTPQNQEARGQRVVVNMADNTFQVHGVVIPEWQFGGGFNMAAAADPALLSENDIIDWPGLLTKVKEEAESPPSPGGQVVAQLDQSTQRMIMSVPVETLVENKSAMIKQINRVLASPTFYDEAAWNGKQLDKQIRDLLTQKNLAGESLTRANRALLESAYPGMITPLRVSSQ